MKFTTRSRYGTRLALDIALHGNDGPVRIKDIAKRQNISVKYLEKLVRDLKQAGYIVSKRGPKGGHQLAKPQDMISVGEIVSVLEGELSLVDCVAKGENCARVAYCMTRDVWSQAAKAMSDKLHSITLAELVEKTRPCRALKN
jgi:Rrf2 family transcriptional regulator, iron-sulfur cluster assembly transcription factor